MSLPLEPSITVRALQPVIAGLEALGYATQPLLAESAIQPAVLENADGRVPHTSMTRFWSAALNLTADDDLGLHLAEVAPLASFGVHAYALQSSPTLREAYRRACRYQRLIHETTELTLLEGEEEGVIVHALPDGRPVARHPAELLAALWVRFGRIIVGTDWAPRLVTFAHAQPAHAAEHARIFASPVLFHADRNAMFVPNAILDTPNAHADPGLAALMDEFADRLLAAQPAVSTFGEQVRRQLLDALPDGVPTAQAVADSLHISVRTLHRNLQQEGTTFRTLLDQLRQEQATRYLADPSISISEAAFLLGFSELSSFYRAFKRWSDVTPAEYRAGLNSSAPRS